MKCQVIDVKRSELADLIILQNLGLAEGEWKKRLHNHKLSFKYKLHVALEKGFK